MKLIVKNEATIGKEELKKTLECGGLHVGDELEIDGALWRVLKIAGRKTMIWKHTGLNISSVFNRDGSNKYEGSDLQKAFRKMETPEELKGLITDEGFFPLSIEEIRELLPTEADRIATDEEGNTVWWWTRSCNRGYGGLCVVCLSFGHRRQRRRRSLLQLCVRAGLCNLLIPPATRAGYDAEGKEYGYER